MRIVSLIPSATEFVALLGASDDLVGVSHECDWPPGIGDDLPRLTDPRVDPEASSGEIDDSIRDLLETGLSIYQLDADRLAELDPDVVITQDQCDVCAVGLDQVERALCEHVGSDVRVVSLQPDRLEPALDAVQQIATALEQPDRGRYLRRELEQGLERAVAEVPDDEPAPTVCPIEWTDPLMVAGHWMPELIERAGGDYDLAEPGGPSQTVTFETIQEQAPDVIAVMPCGFDRLRAAEEVDTLAEHDGWEELEAVREQRVHPVDGHQYFNRSGPRLVDSLSLLVELLWPHRDHPEVRIEELLPHPERFEL